MYTIEHKRYGVKLTVHELLDQQAMSNLAGDLKQALRGKANEPVSVLVDMKAHYSLDGAVNKMIYILNAAKMP
jgi:hypothetical protein